MDVKVGDDVLLPEYGGTPIKMGTPATELFVYRDNDILGILEEKLAEWMKINQSYHVQSI